jgi:cyclohexadienyl dehydratase
MRSCTFSIGLTFIAAAAAVLSGCAMRDMAPAAMPLVAGSHLDAVQKAAVLRICTPGDYKPFSFQKTDAPSRASTST